MELFRKACIYEAAQFQKRQSGRTTQIPPVLPYIPFVLSLYIAYLYFSSLSLFFAKVYILIDFTKNYIYNYFYKKNLEKFSRCVRFRAEKMQTRMQNFLIILKWDFDVHFFSFLYNSYIVTSETTLSRRYLSRYREHILVLSKFRDPYSSLFA